ncbi:MAG: hypothetical protein QXT64_06645 [Desulfurococcaceae archaeon]
MEPLINVLRGKEVEVQKLKLTEEIAVLQEERVNLQASLKALEDGRGL